MERDKHDERAKAEKRNWGLPGNLCKGRSDPIDLVGVLSGLEHERIREFLRDAD